MNASEMRKNFEKIFGGGGDIRVYFAPGRVNLIGEHTDYNGGHVFPCALDIGTYGAARRRDDRKVFFYSMNFEQSGIIEASLDDLGNSKDGNWADYPKGMLWAYEKHGMPAVQGMDILFYGTIPNGSGLSSSSSIDILMGYMIQDIFGYHVPCEQQARLGQFAENRYNGVNCGIMDQFAIVMGKADNAIFLDTATLNYRYAPLSMSGLKIVIANTNKQRKLCDSKYNERRRECSAALSKIQAAMKAENRNPVDSLCALTPDDLSSYMQSIGDDVLYRRARHAVCENFRTVEAAEALEKGDMVRFGRLMTESHISLRDDYEVTGFELDTLVSAALKVDGVLGSRMTGAGFGGCTVSLVKESSVGELKEKVRAEYKSTVHLEPDFYVVTPGEGVHRLS